MNTQEQGADAMGAVGQRVREDARQLVSSVNELSSHARASLDEMIEKRPYATLGVAFAAGYVLAGGLSSRLTRLAVVLGGRYLINTFGSEILESVRR